MKVNLTPMQRSQYGQNPNHDFNFAPVSAGPDHQIIVPWFMCKDYLQDVFWAEHRRAQTAVHGLKYTPGPIDPKADRYLLLVHNGKDSSFAQRHREHLVAFINAFEKAQGWPLTKAHLLDGDGRGLILDYPRDWTEKAALISAFTSVIRVSGQFEKGMDAETYIRGLKQWSYGQPRVNPAYMEPEMMRLLTIRGRFLALLTGKKVPDQPWSDMPNGYSAHGGGIMGFQNFPSAA